MSAVTWAQLVWAAVLAGLLGFHFRRTWRWEHGGDADLIFKKYGRETFVFIPPTTLFWILLVITLLLMRSYGARDGLVRAAALAGDMTLILCVYFLLLLALLPLLRKRVSARACAVLWLVPAFLSWQMNALIQALPLSRKTIYVPRDALPVIGTVWLAGFLAVGGTYLISHLRFRAWVKRNATVDLDAAARGIWNREREAMDYKRDVTLLRADVPAPFSMGRTKWSRCTVLPRRAYTPEELTMIFRHELHHLQRCDVDTKVFLCLCNAFCWFNPLVWIATRKAAEDLERSCDEIVAEGMDAAQRKAYAAVLLDAAAPGRGCTTCLSAAAGTLRYRLKSIVTPHVGMRGTLLLMAAMFVCALCFGKVSFSDARGSFTELLLPEGTAVENMVDARGGRTVVRECDAAAIRAALDGVELEHIAGLRNPVLEKARVTFFLTGGRFATLTEEMLVVKDFRLLWGGTADCYLVRSAVDWDAIENAQRASNTVEERIELS